jgi:hypothetical protein
MAVLEQNPFQNLYDYSTSAGVVIPQTSSVKAMVEQAFSTVFGSEVSQDATTPMGRFIEAITMLIVNVLGVNAQSANMLNPKYAVGNALDGIGALFGIVRPQGMSDAEYRKLILRGQSNGRGFAESVERAVLAVPGVASVVVLNNGLADPSMEPSGEPYTIQVEPHSVAISVRSDGQESTYSAVAKAINDTISLGCGMACLDANMGEEKSIVVDGKTIMFYVPNNEVSDLSYSVRIAPNGYAGDDIEGDVRTVVRTFLSQSNVAGAFTHTGLRDFITDSSIGVICEEASIIKDGSAVTAVILNPKDYIDANPSDSEIEVTVL